jgi:hypothetical protein
MVADMLGPDSSICAWGRLQKGPNDDQRLSNSYKRVQYFDQNKKKIMGV